MKTYKVFCFGRELQSSPRPDGSIFYYASPEMDRRADEVGRFWHAKRDAVTSIVCSSGYPGAAKGMPMPPEGISEAGIQRDRLVGHWNVPSELIQVDPKPYDTFGSFIHPIEDGFIQPGEFTREHRLVVAASGAHAWRIGMLCTAVFQMPEGSLCRLRGGRLEQTKAVRDKERALAILTQQALSEVTVASGTPEYVPAVQENFRVLWRQVWDRDITAINDAFSSWQPPNIPILAYDKGSAAMK